jgi:hypothetical protein
MSGSDEDDPLEALRARVEAAQAAAERLAEEAAAAREEADERARAEPPRSAAEAAAEVQALAAVLHAARALLPEELWAQLCDLLRTLLVFVRAVLDWWIERLEGRPPAPPAVEDIPLA